MCYSDRSLVLYLIVHFFLKECCKFAILYCLLEITKKHCIKCKITVKILKTVVGLGGWYSYRMSKAALNMATKNLSIELGRGSRKVICVALHPGTVDTDLSRPYHKGVPADKLFSTEYCVNKLIEIINQLQFIQSGKYYSWDGNELPF